MVEIDKQDLAAIRKKLQLVVKMRDKLVRLASVQAASLFNVEFENKLYLQTLVDMTPSEELNQINEDEESTQAKSKKKNRQELTATSPMSASGLEKGSLSESTRKRKTIDFYADGTGADTGSAKKRKGPKKDAKEVEKVVKPLAKDESNNVILPVVIRPDSLGEVTIHSVGKIVSDREHYHNPRYIFPVGFKSTKKFSSFLDATAMTIYTSEIIDNGNAPLFQVTAADAPGHVFAGQSTSGAWKQVIDILSNIGSSGAKTHQSGPDLFGLSDLAVVKCIQELEGANKCSKYVFQKFKE